MDSIWRVYINNPQPATNRVKTQKKDLEYANHKRKPAQKILK